MYLCEVLESFAGPEYLGMKGQTIKMPHEIAKAFQGYGLVKIIGKEEIPIAFETATEAKEGKETATIKKTVKKK